MTKINTTLLLALGLALAGCHRGANYDTGYSQASYPRQEPDWTGMMGMGLGLMRPPPRPSITQCSSFGQRGMGFTCMGY